MAHTNVYADEVESGADVSVKFPRKLPYYELEFALNTGTAVSFFSKSLDSLEEIMTDALISIQRAKTETAKAKELQEAVAAKLREVRDTATMAEIITEEGRVGDI